MRVFNKYFFAKYIPIDLITDDIRSWRKFHYKVRNKGCNLLRKLEIFPNSVLIAGCQRSGTTMLSRIITESDGMVKYWFGLDDELDAAQILSGYVEHQPLGRYCFQTTYLNECFHEYYSKCHEFKLIWVLRNPISVIYSMMYNWGRFSFNELFDAVGFPLLKNEFKFRYNKYGKLAVPKILRACLSYNGKVTQVFTLSEALGREKLMVIDYDELVLNKESILPCIYEFIHLPYKKHYSNRMHRKSITKAHKLSSSNKMLVEEVCFPIYEKAKGFIL